jgi:hypothetical protein
MRMKKIKDGWHRRHDGVQFVRGVMRPAAREGKK